MPKSYDVKIDGEPYTFQGSGITFGDSLIDPAPPSQLGSALLENVATGIGPKLGRGNGYYDIHRLIPTVEGQLIFPPMATVGAEFLLTGPTNYTPGLFHHSCPAGQYIAFGTRIYLIGLLEFVGSTYLLVSGSDCTSINANARYTGGAFMWRDRMYFGIEDSTTGQAIGYTWIDLISAAVATVVSDTVKGFSYGASARGRLFTAQNAAAPGPIKLKWSPDMANNYDAAGFALYGDSGTFVYGIETRPRVTGVLMMGSAALFFRDDGSVLASDEAGFIGVSSPRSQSSGTSEPSQGFGPVHYLDGAAYRVFAGGPHHLNPVTLLTRSLSPGNVQDVSIEVQDIDILTMYAVGEHLLMAGASFLYDVLWRTQTPVVHKLMNLKFLCANDGYVAGAMTQQGGILAVTMYNSVTGTFQQLHLELLPSLRVSTEAYSGAAVQGWIEPGILVGPQRAASMTKLWLQVRGTYYTRVTNNNNITFSNGLVDETKPVSIGTVSGVGPFAAQIVASPQILRLGRTLSFRLNMNVQDYTGFNERLYLPLSADFLWSPTVEDKLILKLIATAEQPTRVGGVLVSRSARSVVDALTTKVNTVITVEFSDGNPPAVWTMFVETAEAELVVVADSAYGSDSYVVSLLCRRL